MKGHELTYRREDRYSRIDAPSNKGIESYPCLTSCTEHKGGAFSHNGMNQFIFAHCACGWEELSGTYIHERETLLAGRLAHIQHQMDVLASLGLRERAGVSPEAPKGGQVTRVLTQIKDSIARCHGNITSPAEDDILGILEEMSDWMEAMENGLGANDAEPEGS